MKCDNKDCPKTAKYNKKGEKAKYCKEHMETGMVDITKKLCENPDCNTRATFNLPGEPPKYCYNDKEDGMVNVVKKKCKIQGCPIGAYFNNPEETKGLYCDDHKKDGMINVVNKDNCIDDGCTITATYNLNGKQKLFIVQNIENLIWLI